MNTQNQTNSENNNKQLDDKKQAQSQKSTHTDTILSTGVGTIVGAAIGTVVGTTTANAAEQEVAEENHEVVATPANTQHAHVEPKPEPEPNPEPDPNPEPEPNPEPDPNPDPDPEPDPEPEIRVIGYEVIHAEDGTEATVATLDAEGQIVYVADTDNDGYANIMASDLNENGQFDQGEGVDVSADNIEMAQYQQAYERGLMANTEIDNGPDYINDGNVDDYMA